MELKARRVGRSFVITVAAERIDAAVAIQFKDQVCEMTKSTKGRAILDMHQVMFVDSSGLGAIVSCMKQMPDGQALELATLNPAVAKVFALTRMDTVFAIHPDLDSAVNMQAG